MQYHPHHPRSCQGQGHRLRIFMFNFYAEAFRISLLLNYMMDLVPIWYHKGTGQKFLSAQSALMAYHEIFASVILSLPLISRRAVVSFWRKNVHNTC